MKDVTRCSWCEKDDIYRKYHDEVWGEPEYDSRVLFEFLNLEGAQAGLSWYTILVRFDSYKNAFSKWDIDRIAEYQEKDIKRLLDDPGIIRNKLKVNATISNAQAYIKMRENGEDFSDFLWSFVEGEPIINDWKTMSEVPSKTDISDAMSIALKKRGFKFCGSTICYAFMQATGMVDDHVMSCWKRKNN